MECVRQLHGQGLRQLSQAVRDDLAKYAEAVCFLSEDWVGGFDATVEKCRRRVAAADAFMLLLGHWYGSIPPDSDKSVTHLEFESALDKWRGNFPPVAVMRPRDTSDADDELSRVAEEILAERALQGYDRAAHEQKRLAFRNAVVNSWRTVNEFGTREELTKVAISCALRWQGRTPDRAVPGSTSLKAPLCDMRSGSSRELAKNSKSKEVRASRTPICRERPSLNRVRHHHLAFRSFGALGAEGPGLPVVPRYRLTHNLPLWHLELFGDLRTLFDRLGGYSHGELRVLRGRLPVDSGRWPSPSTSGSLRAHAALRVGISPFAIRRAA